MAEDFSHIFQFTPLREGRHRLMRYRIRFKSFQFTPLREGRLPYYNAQQTAMPISIPAPPRGATPRHHSGAHARPISIPAPPRGATQDVGFRRCHHSYFNSRPSARGDMTHSADLDTVPFQFPPLREGRQQKICNFCKSFVQPSQITAL